MDYPHVYVVLPESEVHINTPWCKSISDIQNSIEQFPDKIIQRSLYPNGLDLILENYGDRVVIRSNRPLIDNGNGTFTAPE